MSLFMGTCLLTAFFLGQYTGIRHERARLAVDAMDTVFADPVPPIMASVVPENQIWQDIEGRVLCVFPPDYERELLSKLEVVYRGR